MHLLNAWREAPIYNGRERAALAWTEAVTKITAVIAINARNRAAIQFVPPRV
jgi:alkylhydroperoxidase family enzyme